MKSEATPGAAGGPTWLARLNEIGERHATAIIAVSTGLIILTVLLFAKGAYDRSQLERAEQDLAKALTIEALQPLKAKYGDTPVAPRIVYKLANKLAEDGKLDAAIAEYKDFLARWPHDSLAPRVDVALDMVQKNRLFADERKPVRLKEHHLQSHPRSFPDLKDARLQYGPARQPNPVAELETPSGIVKIELFEDEAPNAVAAFVQAVDAKAFDGLAWEAGSDDRRLRMPKKGEAPDVLLAFESTSGVKGEAGSVIALKQDAANIAGRFEILARAQPALEDVTVIGVVKEGLDRLKKGEAIKSAKLASRRDHPYTATPLEKK